MALKFRFVLAMVLLVCPIAPATAQDQSLADIRQEMTVLYVEIQKLRRELSTTGGANTALVSGSPLERIDLIEQELQRLTSKTEQLEFRINRVVVDGTNRIGDLEFRLVELEGGDVGALGETTTLGGVDLPLDTPVVSEPTNTAEMAVGEQVDFDIAKTSLDSGDFETAANSFATFTDTYSGGPLAGAAHFHRGEALAQLGRTTDAARAFLQSYSLAPDASTAPDALYHLGISLGALGQINEACVTLGQVEVRYPGTVAVQSAIAAIETLGCS